LGGGGGETHQQLGPAEGREFDGGDPSAVRRTCKQRRRDVLAQWRSSTSTVLTVTTKKKKKKHHDHYAQCLQIRQGAVTRSTTIFGFFFFGNVQNPHLDTVNVTLINDGIVELGPRF
jgi:hypothetical protein